MNTEPQDWQEPHSPTEEALIHNTDGPRTTRQYVRRRVSESRMWGCLNAQQQEYAERLRAGYEINIKGVGSKTQTYEQSSRGIGEISEGQAALQTEYRAWVQNCQDYGIDTAPVVLILFEGWSQNDTDAEFGRRKGWAKGVVIDALDIPCRGLQRRRHTRY